MSSLWTPTYAVYSPSSMTDRQHLARPELGKRRTRGMNGGASFIGFQDSFWTPTARPLYTGTHMPPKPVTDAEKAAASLVGDAFIEYVKVLLKDDSVRVSKEGMSESGSVAGKKGKAVDSAQGDFEELSDAEGELVSDEHVEELLATITKT